jgi:hypothetical protein
MASTVCVDLFKKNSMGPPLKFFTDIGKISFEEKVEYDAI